MNIVLTWIIALILAILAFVVSLPVLVLLLGVLGPIVLSVVVSCFTFMVVMGTSLEVLARRSS